MYLVTGATGQLGRRIVRKLREQNLPVRAFVRLTSRYAELEDRGAEIFIGDLRQDQDIQKACQGVISIISAHGTNEASENSNAQAIDYRANVQLIDQAKAVGVQHFTFISVLGADRGYQDSPVFKAKWEIEKYLQASGLNYTILRPSGFSSNLLPAAERFRRTGVYLLIGDPENRTSIVSTDDLARIAAEASQNQQSHRQVLAVGGPEILQRQDIPKIFGSIFNREPTILNLPLLAVDGLRNVLGIFNPQAKEALGTLRVLLANEFFCTALETEQLESIFALKLETLESFLRRYLSV
jgi:uncharacterized protein YbjT (DUF2867 family)